jgi:hypothetical protein
MSLGARALIDAVSSHAAASGYFDSVQTHEPKSAPGTGLTFAVWLSEIGPARSSGLASTSVRMELTGRIYKPFLSEPEDLIDPTLADAVDALLEALSGDFELGGNARSVDLLGAHGVPLSARAGYQKLDSTVYRVIDIMVPIIINDAWGQNG